MQKDKSEKKSKRSNDSVRESNLNSDWLLFTGRVLKHNTYLVALQDAILAEKDPGGVFHSQ